jgi:DNA-binding NtrC family response regulator
VAGTGARAGDVAEKDLLATVERDHIQRALVRANGNKKAAAKMLGLSRRALYRRLERLDLSETITRRREGAEMVDA